LTLREENIRLILGVKIRQLRHEKGLSLNDVAKTCDISVSYLNEIEKGKKYPKANKLMVMASALGVTYDWLVSLQLPPKLMPIAEMLQSDLLTNLPLEIFGMEPSDLLDTIANTPSKMSAFISTLVEIARNYDIGVENFYYSALRSYQEMHQNYFPDIEEQVNAFVKENPDFQTFPYSLKHLEEILHKKYGYEIIQFDFNSHPELKGLRSVLIPENMKLLVNHQLNDSQKMFTLGREIGYQFMNLKERAYTSSWIKTSSFEQLLNNFKASYFSGALLIPEKSIVKDLKDFISQSEWRGEALIQLMHKYQASPEMFAHRMTGIFPQFFGLNQLFFLRFNHKPQSQDFVLDKELHLAGLYNPHGNMIHEDYCRRWISLNILLDMVKEQSEKSGTSILCQAQRSQYYDSEREFLVISIARGISPTPDMNSSVSIGFLINQDFKKQVKFWNSSQIIVRKVGVTCQRCSAQDCGQRVAEPIIFEKNQKTERIQESLQKLIADLKS
jgi:XRE family transcriptional regulator, fatty acid utilization regulator